MTVIKWEDPPEGKTVRGSGWNGQIILALSAKPNQWALIHEAPVSGDAERHRAYNKGANLRTSAARRGFNVQTAFRLSDGIGRTYARFVTEAAS